MPDLELVRDCARCAALCCVAHPFASSEDFAFDKPADARCPMLRDPNRCGIHASLLERGMVGCVAYDGYGAGQRVTTRMGGARVLEGARDADVLEVFRVVRVLHERMALLDAATRIRAAAPLVDALEEAIAALDALAGSPGVSLERAQPLVRTSATLIERVRSLVGAASGPPRRRALRVVQQGA